MAVYEHNYKPYEGPQTAGWSRFLVIPRYVYEDLFKYKLFIALFVICFVCPLVYTILIYLHHNTSALAIFGINSTDVVPINGMFFKIFATIQTTLAFIFTVIIGPVLISRDLANNALPLYLCRPFSRWEYILGKLSVLMILLSIITWVPGLLLFFFQSYLEGGNWMIENFWIARGIFVLSLVWVVALGLLALAFSAWIRWRTAASAALFAIFIIPTPIGFAIQEMLGTTKGHLANLGMAFNVMADEFFRTVTPEDRFFSLGEAWVVFLVYGLICFYMLWRKVRAYEVISS
ncbi:MAG: ABC transporter permease [Blastocatellales bacterium]